jgi:BASS family bile acid:Na+ symporter
MWAFAPAVFAIGVFQDTAEQTFMTRLGRLLQSRNFIFLLSLVLGLAAPAGSHWTRYLMLPALGLAMTLSAMNISTDLFRSPRSLFFPALGGILMSYVVLANFLIGLGAVLVSDEALWTGLVIIAAVPPAVAVIPFADLLEGNHAYALIATMGAYIGALIIMPLVSIGLLGTHFMDPWGLLSILLELIVLPLFLSRLLIRRSWHTRLAPLQGTMTDWSFFVVMYTIVGLNRDLLLAKPASLLSIALVLFSSMFLLGFLIEWIGSLLHISHDNVVSLVLLGTLKNYGLAAGIAVTLFSVEASVPMAVATFFLIPYVLWLDFRKRHRWHFR